MMTTITPEAHAYALVLIAKLAEENKRRGEATQKEWNSMGYDQKKYRDGLNHGFADAIKFLQEQVG